MTELTATMTTFKCGIKFSIKHRQGVYIFTSKEDDLTYMTCDESEFSGVIQDISDMSLDEFKKYIEQREEQE